jgi:DNA-binding MarR family transcriptional regulator
MGSRRRAATTERVRWLSRDQERAWRALASLVHQLRFALECQLERDSDLSFIEYHALARLSEEPDHRLRMSELAAATNGSLSRLSHLVKRLEGWGYVRREPDPTDGRFTIAVLTEAGYSKLVAAAPAHVAAVRQLVIDEFNAAELAQLRSMCERIAARVEASEWKLELT